MVLRFDAYGGDALFSGSYVVANEKKFISKILLDFHFNLSDHSEHLYGRGHSVHVSINSMGVKVSCNAAGLLLVTDFG